ncbi:hypothetical protein M0R45_005133 [Rubus argutus]|uniref:Uncharacterized protein n=1 Tax=Rubus argutus TaxID=59490 RepID=A0AAW1YLU4_RUBAR
MPEIKVVSDSSDRAGHVSTGSTGWGSSLAAEPSFAKLICGLEIAAGIQGRRSTTVAVVVPAVSIDNLVSMKSSSQFFFQFMAVRLSSIQFSINSINKLLAI